MTSSSWKLMLQNKRFRNYFIITLVGFASFFISLPYFFNLVLLPRPGIQINDFVLNSFTPRDWSVAIFTIIYPSICIFLIVNSNKPEVILIALQTYVAVNFTRLLSLYIFTLEAPEGIIPLNDPLLTNFAYDGPVFVKDLFFSGHISSLFILFIAENRRTYKYAFLLATVAVSLMIIWQRVHYTIDILAAPLVVWIYFKLFYRLNGRIAFYIPDNQSNT